MIDICSIDQANPKKYKNAEKYDEVWAIVRNLKDKPSYVTHHVPELSPSLDLLTWYRRQVDSKHWDKNTFENGYRPRFESEMKDNEAAEAKIKELKEKNDQGKKIALCCFCKDVSLCHRSIVSEMLDARGISHTLFDKEKTEGDRMAETNNGNQGAKVYVVNPMQNEQFNELLESGKTYDFAINIDPNLIGIDKKVPDITPLMPDMTDGGLRDRIEAMTLSGKITQNGRFRDDIAPDFLSQIHTRQPARANSKGIHIDDKADAQDWLAFISKAAAKGKRIAITTAEPINGRNTSSIIIGMLQNAGISVMNQTSDIQKAKPAPDMSRFADAYKFAYGEPDFHEMSGIALDRGVEAENRLGTKDMETHEIENSGLSDPA